MQNAPMSCFLTHRSRNISENNSIESDIKNLRHSHIKPLKVGLKILPGTSSVVVRIRTSKRLTRPNQVSEVLIKTMKMKSRMKLYRVIDANVGLGHTRRVVCGARLPTSIVRLTFSDTAAAAARSRTYLSAWCAAGAS